MNSQVFSKFLNHLSCLRYSSWGSLPFLLGYQDVRSKIIRLVLDFVQAYRFGIIEKTNGKTRAIMENRIILRASK